MRVIALGLGLLCSACGSASTGACPQTHLPSLGLESVVDGLVRPIWVGQAPGDTQTLYVAEQVGRIRLVRNGAVAGTFLDISDAIGCTGADAHCLDNENSERGLLGVAFHPGFASNGRFFVYYADITTGQLHNRVVELHRMDADHAASAEVARLIDAEDPETNHNGGNIVFGADGMLYVGIGDGGGGCDGHGMRGNAQNLMSPFGKLHRLNVDAPPTYAAGGNPFAGMGLATIWSYGLRNPWRWSFDRVTGDLLIGDVGQETLEEIDFTGGGVGGQNYGWRVYEADQISHDSSGCDSDPPLMTWVHPAYVVPHSGGVLGGACAIVGGYVYRGSAIADLRGWYLFSDNCNANVGALRICGGAAQDAQVVDGISGQIGGIASFGEGLDGELYIAGLDGSIHKIVAR